MNELVIRTDARGTSATLPPPPVASRVPQKPAGVPAPGTVVPPPLPAVPIGRPGYKFKFPVESPQGQDERREHERLRKADKRAALRPAEPPPLPPPPMVGAPASPDGQPLHCDAPAPGAVAPEPFVPWVAGDIQDTFDELVELSEAKRVAEFVAFAREAGMPPKFIAQVEKDSGYPVKTKAALKVRLAELAAKWLNKTGVSAKNKEEFKVLWCVVTIKMQGVRLKRDLAALIEADRAKRKPEEGEKE